MRILKFLFVFCCFCLSTLGAEALKLEGFISKDEVEAAEAFIAKVEKAGYPELVIEVNSSSGQLQKVLELAKKVYALKAEKGTRVLVYIDQNAVGPAAVIPFLADELYISHFVSWGDIPLGSEDVIPTNILRNTVKSFIRSDHSNRPLLSIMALAMTDPWIEVADDKGWKIGKEGSIVSAEGETLVVNHNQLQQLGLVKEVISPITFRKRFKKSSVVLPESKDDRVDMRSVLDKLKTHIVYDQDGPNQIGLIKVDQKKSQISQATWIYIKNALDYYKKTKPKFVILELNTPGGEVFASQKISDALKEFDTQYDIPVVAFINNWAISAGAMLAYSCRFIALSKDASMGAAEPVHAGEGGKMVTASEKINSALRTDFANRAAFFDRNSDIAEAMVDKDIILVFRHGKIVRLDDEKRIQTKGPNPDIVITAKGKLLTLNAGDLMKYGVADIKLEPAKVGFISDQEKEKGKWPASKMLLFKDPFFKQIPNATVDLYKMDWKTQFLSMLSSPAVASLLFLGMMLGFYIEFNSPGFGFPGSVGILCLFLIVLSSFALDVANTLELILLLVGLAFIALDVFLIPTFGILGFIGVIFFFIGLFGMMLPGIESVDFELDTQTFNAAGEVFIQRLAWLSGSLVFGIISIALLARYVMPSFQGFQHLVLAGNEETAENGYVAGVNPSRLPQPGTKGIVMATLRPAGKIVIENEIYDAVSSGDFIEKNSPIRIVRLDGSVIVVESISSEE